MRERLVYIEPANEDVVLGFNPLLYATEGEGYYKVQRATEIILRAWESVNIEAMPRLARWTFNAFWAAAQLGLTIADCAHFLMPGSRYHQALLRCLPEGLQARVERDHRGAGIEVAANSSNRPETASSPTSRATSCGACSARPQSRLDVLRFMREGRIVLLNLAPKNRLPTQLADAIGGLVLNEVLATAQVAARWDVRYPTYLLLDEFQNFVGPDIESALPEVRQLGHPADPLAPELLAARARRLRPDQHDLPGPVADGLRLQGRTRTPRPRAGVASTSIPSGSRKRTSCGGSGSPGYRIVGVCPVGRNPRPTRTTGASPMAGTGRPATVSACAVGSPTGGAKGTRRAGRGPARTRGGRAST